MYEVYATRFDNPAIVEELVPARGIEFSLPVSNHGEASFTATVEPGRSFWRKALALPVSGILIARDGVPVWQGWVSDERPVGPRSFSFSCREWGAFFEEKVPAVPRTWRDVNDHEIFRNLIEDAQSISGQDLQIVMGDTTGASVSDRTVNAWDDTTVGREFRSLGEAEGGPEWYFGTGGTLDAPQRILALADRHGHAAAQTVLEFVEDTEDYEGPGAPPSLTLLGDMFMSGTPLQVPARRAGGNLIAQGRTQSVANSATVAIATGSGEERARLTQKVVAASVINRGYPRMTTTANYSDVSNAETLLQHAYAELGKRCGVATGYSLVSLDGDPDWLATPRGSTVRVVLDTDVYGAERPVGGPDGFDARCVDMAVRVGDDGPAQVEWRVADVLEVN